MRPDVSDIKIALKSANTAGMAVAGLQTAYQDCGVNAGPEDSESFATAMKKNAESLDVYFDDDRTSSKKSRILSFMLSSSTHASQIRPI